MIGIGRKVLGCALFAVPVVFAGSALAEGGQSRAATVSTIFSFPDVLRAGRRPSGGLYRDSKGNFFGTTRDGGDNSAGCTNGCGTIFRLVPPSAGKPGWKHTVLHRFTLPQGDVPTSGLAANSAGTLFGNASSGGANDEGSIFKLVPPAQAGDPWRFNVVHSFIAEQTGSEPVGDLLIDNAGALYGTTADGGPGDDGTIFKLTPPKPPQKTWAFRILRSFGGNNANGESPSGGLVADANGRLYGSTGLGGTFGMGLIFRLTPRPGGSYAFRVLHHFAGGANGAVPRGTLVLRNNILYGATSAGGIPHVECEIGTPSPGCGIIFSLRLPATPGGNAVFRNLWKFNLPTDGGFPEAGLTLDPDNGALYGVTRMGGPNDGQGTIFRLLPPPPGQTAWRFQRRHAFSGMPDGDDPTGTLLRTPNGNLYGTSQFGGVHDEGTVFVLRP